MQPRNPYQGQPTSNMDFPTEAYMAAAADAAKTQADAQAKLGAQIGQVISSVAGAYAGYKQQQSQAKSYEGFLRNPIGQKMLGIDANAAEGYIKAAKEMGGAREQIQFYQMGVAPMMQQNFMMERIKASNPAKPAPSYPAITFEESPLSSPAPSPAPSGGMMVGPNLGDDVASPPVYDKDQTDYIDFMKKKGWAGGPVKQAWIDEYNDQRAFPQPLPRKK